MRKSLRFLYEMFLREARFPDEKFWNKSGDPIRGPRKGPPTGTVGRSAADYKAMDYDPATDPDNEFKTCHIQVNQSSNVDYVALIDSVVEDESEDSITFSDGPGYIELSGNVGKIKRLLSVYGIDPQGCKWT